MTYALLVPQSPYRIAAARAESTFRGLFDFPGSMQLGFEPRRVRGDRDSYAALPISQPLVLVLKLLLRERCELPRLSRHIDFPGLDQSFGGCYRPAGLRSLGKSLFD